MRSTLSSGATVRPLWPPAAPQPAGCTWAGAWSPAGRQGAGQARWEAGRLGRLLEVGGSRPPEEAGRSQLLEEAESPEAESRPPEVHSEFQPDSK